MNNEKLSCSHCEKFKHFTDFPPNKTCKRVLGDLIVCRDYYCAPCKKKKAKEAEIYRSRASKGIKGIDVNGKKHELFIQYGNEIYA